MRKLKVLPVRVVEPLWLRDRVGEITFLLTKGFEFDVSDRDLLVELLSAGKIEPANAAARTRVNRLSMSTERRSKDCPEIFVVDAPELRAECASDV